MAGVEVPQTLEYRGGQLNAAPVLETGDERKAANLDQRLKLLIMYVLLDDQMNYVINCLTAKSTWDDLILYHEGPSDVKESRVMDLKLCYNTFKFKKGESLTQTFTRYKALMNKLVNDGIKLSKLEINTGFINGLPKKWLSYYQSLRNTNNVKDSELASLFGKLKYEENLIDSIYETKKNKSLVSATPLSTAFFTSSIIQDFQDSPDDEEDTRSEEVSSNDNEMVEVKVLMALAEENDNVSKEGAGNGEWGQKDLVFVKSLANDTKVTIPGVERPWLSEAGVTDYNSINDLQSKSTFKAEALKGVIINEPSPAPAKGNKSSTTSKVHSAPAGKLKSVKIKDNPPLANCDIRKPIWNLDSGCSRHMNSVKIFTKVAFVNGLKYNLISISQLCDAKYIVQFDEKRGTIFNSNKEVVMIALRVRDVYVLDMTSFVQESCFFAKASENLNWLWHKRLAHLNFKTINKLAKQNLVTGLPSLVYSKDKLFLSCEKGKHHRASFKTKQTSSIKKCLHLLHMDLFGPVTPRSINHEKYTLVIVDEYSRYTWVYFLKKKSQAPETIMSFIKRVENQNDIKFKQLRTDNVYIHNHKDHLGKFDEKVDNGYLLGYTLVSKAFRVFNTRRQQTKETYHIIFDESPDAIKFSKPSVDNINIAKT
ncbi:retrovirus-related pol polyprotein from transposon TNT 1-94 [Tanacetum coccineum]